MDNTQQAEVLKQHCVTVVETRNSIEIVFDMNAAKEIRRNDYELYSEYLQYIDCFTDIFMAWQSGHNEEELDKKYFRLFNTHWMILQELGKNAVDHADWSRFTCKRITHADNTESIDWEFLTCGRSENPEHLRRFYKSLTFCNRELVETSKEEKNNHNKGLGTMIVLTSAETLDFPVSIQKELHAPFIWLKYSGLWHESYGTKNSRE